MTQHHTMKTILLLCSQPAMTKCLESYPKAFSIVQYCKETYSLNEEETESDSTDLVWKLFEIRRAKLLTASELARYQGTSEEKLE